VSSSARDSGEQPRVLHMTIGNEWAGVAAHLHDLLPGLQQRGVDCGCALFSDGLLAERLRESAIPVHLQQRAIRYDPRVPFRVRRLLRERGTQVLHMHGYMAIVYGCLASLGMPIRRVVTFHQPSQRFSEIGNLRFRYSLKFAYRLAKSLGARFIAVSGDVRQSYLDNYGLDAERVSVIRNGVALDAAIDDNRRIGLRAERDIPEGRPNVAIVGRLDPIKGHRHFLDAAARLTAQGVELNYLVLGEGPLREELEQSSASLGLSERVRFYGFRKDVTEFLAVTDVLVIASDFEGLPYTLLQAMSAGVAVVATRCEGLVEVLRDGIDALLVERGAPEELADAVRRLIEDPQLRERLGAAGRQKIEQEFSREAMVETTLAMYRDLLHSA